MCARACTHMHGCTQPHTLSPVQLFLTPWTVAHQAPLSMEFSRQESLNRFIPTTWDFPNPGINLNLLCLLQWQADSSPLHHLGSPSILYLKLKFEFHLFNIHSYIFLVPQVPYTLLKHIEGVQSTYIIILCGHFHESHYVHIYCPKHWFSVKGQFSLLFSFFFFFWPYCVHAVS